MNPVIVIACPSVILSKLFELFELLIHFFPDFAQYLIDLYLVLDVLLLFLEGNLFN